MLRKVIAVTIILLNVWSCQKKGSSIDPKTIKIPDIQLDIKNKALKCKAGRWFYQGKLYTGKLLEKYPSGKTKSLISYYQGKEHGWAKGWYPGGQPWFERPYILGKKEGIHKTWWQNGQIKEQAFIKQDVYEGNVKAWYVDGKVYRDFNYKNGQEEGHQRMWKSDGRIKANYVVTEGRRYGLTGVTNCKTAVEKNKN